MNYGMIYESLITRAQHRIDESETFYEVHHIIPKCMGGSDDPSNLVKLTPEEHYVAHQLLAKQYSDNRKLLYAAAMMSVDRHGHRVNNKRYGWIKRRICEMGVSEEVKEKLRGRKLSPEHARKIQEAKIGRTISDQGKENIRKSKTGEKNPMFGKDPWNKEKSWSEESKRKMSESSKGFTHTDESKEKLRIKAKAAWARRKAKNET